MSNGRLPNICIDKHRAKRHEIGLYLVWPTLGGGYIVAVNRDGETVVRDRYETEADARCGFNAWVDVLAARDAHRGEADILATLRQF